jgi:hypothetical protein
VASGDSLRARGGATIRNVVFHMGARQRTGLSGWRCGRNRPLWWVAEDAQRLETGEECNSSLYRGLFVFIR